MVKRFFRKNDVLFGRKSILGNKEKNIICKQHKKGKSVAWLSKFFHVASKKTFEKISTEKGISSSEKLPNPIHIA